MSQSTRIEGTQVYCHSCEHEWERAHGGLQCPNCRSEFVEILEASNRPRDIQDTAPAVPTSTRPQVSQPLHDHNPWNVPDPAEDDISTYQFNTNGGRGTLSFTSRTYTFGGGSARIDASQAELGNNFQTMLGSILGAHNTRRPASMMGGHTFQNPQQQQSRSYGSGQPDSPQDIFQMFFSNMPGSNRQSNTPSSPFDFLSMMLNPGNAQHGDTVFSQEAFDRVMSQLMEQHQTSGAPGPASESAINSLKKKRVDKTMMGNDGKAECSICMDNVEILDEVTILPCNHWFHHDCIVSWLKEHDTCPHCRQPITTQENSRPTAPPLTRPSPTSAPRSYTFGSNLAQQSSPNEESIARLRQQRRYSALHRDVNSNSDEQQQQPNTRNENSGGGTGVGDWIRNHMSF